MNERRVIEGGVSAAAGAAQVAVNEVPTHYIREIPHARVRGEQRQTLTEYVPENDTELAPVFKGHNFWGHGRLQAETQLGPMERVYQFPVPALDLAEAWRNFDDAADRAAAVETQRFREEYQEHLVNLAKQQQQQIATVRSPGAAEQLLRSGPSMPPGKILAP